MSKLPVHLMVSDIDGALHDTRIPDWSSTPLRRRYRGQFDGGEISGAVTFKAALRAGAFTDLGGYPLYFVMSDGEALSYEAARGNARPIFEALENKRKTGFRGDCWLPVAVAVNYEDSDLVCSHTGDKIPSAYGDNEPEEDNEPEPMEPAFRKLA